jgi:hypothetical protein
MSDPSPGPTNSLGATDPYEPETKTDRGSGSSPTAQPGCATSSGTVLGDYELLDLLGRGGMGVVHRARQCSANRIVALKVIRPDLLDGIPAAQQATVLERFRTEAQAAARIEHEHVVTVYEVGEAAGCLYYSMRYVEGQSLADVLRNGPVSNEQAAAYLEPVARAVHCAHGQRILHRDLKPRNILVDREGRPFVADFGLAKSLESAQDLTHSGECLGTPSYMAPEQAQDAARATEASDVYSLGATLYALLTGRPPFQAATVAETLHQVKYEEPVPPRQLNPAVARDLETITLKCLQKEPSRRYRSALELAEDLGRYREGQPILARPVGATERVIKWVKRRPLVTALSAAIVILFLAGVGLWVHSLIAANDAANNQVRLFRNMFAKSAADRVGDEKESLSPTEHEALWDLASIGDEEVHLLFIEKGLAGPKQAERFYRRREMAVHAAVGLNPARRDKVLQVLLRKMRDDQQHLTVREVSAFLVTALQPKDEAIAREATRTILEALEHTNNPTALADQSSGLVELAPRLQPDEAAAAMQKLLDAMPKVTNPYATNLATVNALFEAVAALAPRLSPAQAADATQKLLSHLTEEPQTGELGIPGAGYGIGRPEQLTPFSRALGALAARLEPDQATAAFQKALEVAVKPDNWLRQGSFVTVAVVLAGKLGPEDAAVAFPKALDALVKPDLVLVPNQNPLGPLVVALAGRLGPKDAPAAARKLLEAIPIPGQGADPIARIMGIPQTMSISLLEAIGALAPRLQPDEAGRVVRKLLDTDHLARNPSPKEMGLPDGFGGGLGGLGGGLAGAGNPPTLVPLLETVAVLTGRLEAEEARKVSKATTEKLLKGVVLPVEATLVLAGRLSPDEAAKVSAAALKRHREGLMQGFGGLGGQPLDHAGLVRAAAALAPRVGQDEASKLLVADTERLLANPSGTGYPQASFPAASNPGFPEGGMFGAGSQVTARGPLLDQMLTSSLKPDEAAAAVRKALDVMYRTTDLRSQSALGEAVAALAGRLPAEDARKAASAAARLLVDRLEKVPRPGVGPGGQIPGGIGGIGGYGIPVNHSDLTSAGKAVAALAARLPADEANKVAKSAARKLLDAIPQSQPGPALLSLLETIALLEDRLVPDEASKAALVATQRLVGNLEKAKPNTFNGGFGAGFQGGMDMSGLGPFGAPTTAAPPTLTETVGSLAGRLSREDAASLCRKASEALGKTTNASILIDLIETVTALAGRLDQAEARKVAASTFEALLDYLARAKRPAAGEAWTGFPGADFFGGRQPAPPPPEAPSGQLARVFGRAVTGLAARLGPEEAATVAHKASGALTRTTDPPALAALCQVVTALASRLGADEAGKWSAAATQKLLDVIPKTTDPSALLCLGEAMATLTGRLVPEEASKASADAARMLLASSPKIARFGGGIGGGLGEWEESESPDAQLQRTLVPFSQAMAALATGLGPEEAATSARKFLDVMAKTTELSTLNSLSKTVEALARRLRPEDEAKVLAALAQTLLDARALQVPGRSSLSRASGPGLDQTVEALAARLSTQALVDLLKQPTCVGPARRLVLGQLGRRLDREFEDLWEFVAWAREHQPGLDLTSPPRRFDR